MSNSAYISRVFFHWIQLPGIFQDYHQGLEELPFQANIYFNDSKTHIIILIFGLPKFHLIESY